MAAGPLVCVCAGVHDAERIWARIKIDPARTARQNLHGSAAAHLKKIKIKKNKELHLQLQD